LIQQSTGGGAAMADIGPQDQHIHVFATLTRTRPGARAVSQELRVPEPEPVPMPTPEPLPQPDPVPNPDPVPQPPSSAGR
jgi:hypothetical protein